ncbi:MAG: hypothetical protein HGA44_10040 [Cellulomonadaceae bacterium]|nr:hypothetical protein [Cellulomonadaceae bacterium]
MQTSVAAEWWLLFFVTLPIAVLLATLAARRLGVLRAMARPLLVVAGLTGYGTLYVAWWLAVTSTEKAWLRRITIGLFVLMLAAALLSLLVARLLYRSPRPHGGLPLPVASVTTAATTLALAVIVAQGLGASLDTLTSASRLSEVAEVSDEVADLSAEGADLYGIGWWSAPVVSLYSGVGMENLSQTDYCDPDTLAVIQAGEAYMVWDFYAENLASPTPNPYAEVVYERTSLGNDFATLWRITLPEGACD